MAKLSTYCHLAIRVETYLYKIKALFEILEAKISWNSAIGAVCLPPRDPPALCRTILFDPCCGHTHAHPHRLDRLSEENLPADPSVQTVILFVCNCWLMPRAFHSMPVGGCTDIVSTLRCRPLHQYYLVRTQYVPFVGTLLPTSRVPMPL